MTLADKFRSSGSLPQSRPQNRKTPLWQGPEKDGVTFSLLSRFLCCRERFRLLVVEGLRPVDAFNHRIEYGQMWHVCEEAHACENLDWLAALKQYTQTIYRRYPTAQEQVYHWYNVCKTQFPLYVDYWQKHPDVVGRTPLLQEQVFDVAYRIPSGRVVRLRGKWDAVDLIGSEPGRSGIYIQEDKTKGEINEVLLKRQLTFDLQTMMYFIALEVHQKNLGLKDGAGFPISTPILGVRYNVVRRPLSGGKGSIVRHKPTKSNPLGESKEAYYRRLSGVISEDLGHYFMRWKVEVHPSDVVKFRQRSLDPILEQLCYWYDTEVLNEPSAEVAETYGYPPSHWRHPFGVYNVLNEGGASDLDTYLESGSEVGLTRTDNLFPELS